MKAAGAVAQPDGQPSPQTPFPRRFLETVSGREAVRRSVPSLRKPRAWPALVPMRLLSLFGGLYRGPRGSGPSEVCVGGCIPSD